MLEVELPYPPSVNHYWRHFRGRMVISRWGLRFRDQVRGILARMNVKPLAGKLAVSVEVFPPDRRRQDLDNLLKAIGDSLEHGGAFHDDSQIVWLLIEKASVVRGGKRGDRTGLHWRVPNVQGRLAVRYALIDTNYWKSFVHARLVVPMGDPGCLSLFAPPAGHDHRLLSEHLTAEYRVKTEGRGRQVDEWKLRKPGLDNHWLDCLVGCAVTASMQGCVLFGTDTKRDPNRPRLKLSTLQRRSR